VKLTYAIVFTSDMRAMTEFYREALKLETAGESPFFTEFRTGATSFALLAIESEQKPEIELCFTTDRLDSDIRGLRARGMRFADEVRQQPFGRIIHMRDPEGTLVTLLEPTRPAAGSGEPELGTTIVNAWDFGAAVNFYRERLGLATLAELPDFTALRGSAPGPQHAGTIDICPSLDYMERAYDEAKYGNWSSQPFLEAVIPTVYDDSIAPKGRHIMSVFCQFAPYDLKQGTWDTEKEKFGDRVTEMLTRHAPNFAASVLHRQVISPLDLERDFGLTHGNIFQGDMTLDQLFFMRPIPGFADYRTPLRGLYMCGACTHPGGGVMGAAGHNAAREILRDFGGRRENLNG